MNMTDKLVRQASMCVWIEVMRVGSDTFGDPFSKNLTKLAILFDSRHPHFFCQIRKDGDILLNEVVLGVDFGF